MNFHILDEEFFIDRENIPLKNIKLMEKTIEQSTIEIFIERNNRMKRIDFSIQFNKKINENTLKTMKFRISDSINCNE